MKVAIDTNGMYTTQAGVARYIRGLLGGLDELKLTDVATLEFAWEVSNFAYRQPARMIKTFYRDFIWRLLLAPSALRKNDVQLLHSTVGAFVNPPRGIRHVATIHDMAVFRFPERFRRWQRISGKRIRLNTANVDQIICISQFTADETMKILGTPAKRIQVVHNGCDFQPDGPPPNERQPDFVVPDDFFLFVGSLEPGKNLRLLKAVYELAEAKGVTLPPLLIVGARWEGVTHEGRPPGEWQYLGRQSDEVLVYLYRRALALAFPSKYEGFGLPVAEAMALGCPVICAPVASLPEIGGDAPCYEDLEPEAWLKTMVEIAKRSSSRDQCVEAGLIQSRNFSWKKCADKTAEIYRSISGGF